MSDPESITIAIAGGGTMGRNIALHLLLHGQEVRLYDTRAQALTEAWPQMQAAVDFMVRHRLPVPVADWGAGLSLHADLATAAAGADLVIEAIAEDLAASAHC